MYQLSLRRLHRVRTFHFKLAAALLVIASLGAAQQRGLDQRTPKVVVLLVVDQFRADYIDRYRHQWSSGLKRLVGEGAWFHQAYYPYFNAVTCPGHATVSTGAVPALHGMILNNWWDRARSRSVTCTEDERYTTISYGKPVSAVGDSAARMLLPAFADEVRAQRVPTPHIVAFSLKARAAIPLGGRKPDAVAWFDDSGAWITSSAFARAPVPAVADFIRRNPVERDFGRRWERTLPAASYLYESPPIGLRVANGMTATFPHRLNGLSAGPDETFYDQWQSSPFADEYLSHLAFSVAESVGFAATPGPHLLAISFSTLDKVGHDFGPDSHEVQDILVRLDRTLGDLFASLDRLVGAGNYTVALTGDHGVPPVPERLAELGIDAGRVRSQLLTAVAEQSIAKTLGAGKHVANLSHNFLYLEPGVYEKLRGDPAGLRTLAADLTRVPGVARVYSRDDLETPRPAGDRIGQQAALSYFEGRSGDLMIVFKPYWIDSNSTTTHGSGYQYDTHVPLLLMGAGIAAGEYLTPASPADIAPTLAFLCGITLPQVSGRVLTEALVQGRGQRAEGR